MQEFLKKSSTNFGEVRDGRRSLPLWFDIDLTAARSVALGNPTLINIAGNSFYIDADANNGGNATVHFQDTNLDRAAAPFFVSPGFIANVPFTQLLIENTAQPGKRLRVFYGVDVDFQAGVNSSITISGTVEVNNPLAIRPEDKTGTWGSTSALVANTAVQVFAPAANPNGTILLNASIFGGNAASLPAIAMIAKSSAPANVIDGDVILASDTYMGAYYGSGRLAIPQFISPGDGLYVISAIATIGGQIHSARWKHL